MTAQPALFKAPKASPVKRPKSRAKPSWRARWTAYSGHLRCDDCVMAIHEGLTTTAPQVARRRREVGMLVTFLCYQHALIQEDEDNKT